MLILRMAESAFWLRWFMTPIESKPCKWLSHSCFPSMNIRRFHEHALRIVARAIVRAQVNRTGVDMTSFNSVDICDHCVPAYTSNTHHWAVCTILKSLHFWAAFMLILRRQNQRFETLISKRRSRNALHGNIAHKSLRDRRPLREHALRIVRGYCSSSSVLCKGVNFEQNHF